MKLRGKSLFWFAMMAVMFLAVVSCGCGGGGGSGDGNDSESVNVPGNPNNNQDNSNQAPDPAPDNNNPAPSPSPDDNNGLDGTWEIESASYSITHNGKTYNFSYIEGSSLTFTISLTATSYYDEGYYTITLSGDAVAEADRYTGEVLGIEDYHQMFGGVSVKFSNDDNYPYHGETASHGFSGGNSFQHDENGTYRYLSVDKSNQHFYPETFIIKDGSHVQVLVTNSSDNSSGGIFNLKRVN